MTTEDLFQKLRHMPGWIFRSYPAIVQGKPLWEKHFTLKLLHDIEKNIGSIAFARQYMLRPISAKGAQLRTEWLRFFSVERDEIHHWNEADRCWENAHIKLQDLLIYQGVDPTRGSRDVKRADYAAIATIGWHKQTKTAYLLDIFRKKMTLPEQIREINVHYQTWKPVCVYVEENLYKELGQWLRELTSVPFRMVSTIKDKVARIQQLGCHFEQGRIFIKFEYSDFRLEYAAFDGMQMEHDDQLDAINVAMQAVPKGQLILPVIR